MGSSKVILTPQQQTAVEAAGTDILVAAAAGSGKTATLVERVIRMLTRPQDPVDVDRLLVVTFTEAAATEVRNRIGSALQDALASRHGEPRLQRQLALLGRAHISTLHSFCFGLIRQYFYRLDLDPGFAVMDEHEALLLRSEVLDQLMARKLENEHADGPFYALVDSYGGKRGDEDLRRLIVELHGYVQTLPWPQKWLDDSLAAFHFPPGTPLASTTFWQEIKKHWRLLLMEARAWLQEAARLTWEAGGPEELQAELAAEIEQLSAAVVASKSDDWEKWREAVFAVTFPRLPAWTEDTAEPAVGKRVRGLRDRARKIVKEFQEGYFSRPPEQWLADLAQASPYIETLVALVNEFAAAYQAAKAEQGQVDFADLEHLTLRLLSDPAAPPGERPSDVARELRSRFAEIIVDEYQDINATQDAILGLLTADSPGGPHRFLVGDVKQSIYGFRHAEPSLFMEKYRRYQPWGTTVSAPGRRIILGTNFRSRKGIVDAVNFVFRQIMTTETGGIPYDADAELIYGADYPPLPAPQAAGGEVPVELHLIEQQNDGDPDEPMVPDPVVQEAAEQKDDEDDEINEESSSDTGSQEKPWDLADLRAIEREARLVAWRIRNLVTGTASAPRAMVWDRETGQYRPIRYRDIVILLRAPAGRANIYLEALGQAGVPAYTQVATGYFSATEVQVMLSLLQVLDNPRQDIPLAAVLRSPLAGLHAEDLAKIRLAAPNASFYDAVLQASKTATDAPLRDALARLLDALERWRTAARRRPLSQVIWQIYQDTEYLHYVQGMPGGAQREANLLALYERARQFDQFARQGLFRFLRFIERLQEEGEDMGVAPVSSESEDVVRLMSIHKSKGLEFPVVVLAGLGMNLRSHAGADVIFHRRLGFGPQLVDTVQRVKYPTLAYQAVRKASHLDDLAEELRVLYVAMTRARERLILVASARNLKAKAAGWAIARSVQGWPLPGYFLTSATSYLDWLGCALMRHPDAQPLRDLAGVDLPANPELTSHPSRWQVQVWNLQNMAAALDPGASTQEKGPIDWKGIGAMVPLGRTFAPETVQPLQSKLFWKYPYAQLSQRFAKLAATEIPAPFQSGDEPPAAYLPPHDAGPNLVRRPQFIQAKRQLTPAELGTLLHRVLQHVDLARTCDAADLADQLQEMVARHLITAADAEAVDVQPLALFFASPLGRRARAHPERVRREVAFTLAVPALEVYPDLDPAVGGQEKVIVQGTIDLLIEEPEGFVLVDYKTGDGDPAVASLAYKGQINVYRRAVEGILGRPVHEAYLYFVPAGQAVPM